MSSLVTLKSPPDLHDHRLGSLNSSLVIVEYSDFICPYSADAAEVMKRVKNRYKDSCYIFRHFPLTNVHPYSGLAAMASEAASVQGKFWEMHHALFANQPDIDPEMVLTIASEIDLDVKKFVVDLEDEILLERVQRDYRSGIESSVSGTPTLFINGISFDGTLNFEEITKEIDQAGIENQGFT